MNCKKQEFNLYSNFMSSWRRSGTPMKLEAFMKSRYGVVPEDYTVSIEADAFIGAYIKFEGTNPLAKTALSNVRIPLRPICLKDCLTGSSESIIKSLKIMVLCHYHTKIQDDKTEVYKSTNISPIVIAVAGSAASMSLVEVYTIE